MMLMPAQDKVALDRCLELARGLDRGRAEQIEWMLAHNPWDEVAEFACYVVQIKALGLKPWETPPSSVNEDAAVDECDEGAQTLLRRMLAAGLSRYEPNPLAALEEAKANR